MVGRSGDRARSNAYGSPQSARWCFTINNPDHVEWLRVLELAHSDECKFLIYADEVGDSGTPHIQGFLVLRAHKRLSAMRQLLPGAHLECARGTSAEAAAYCRKDGKFEEFGVCPCDTRITPEKNATDWALVRSQAEKGEFELIRPDVYVRYYANLHKIFRDAQPNPDGLSELRNMWIYSAGSGLGKSRTLFERFPGAYRKFANKWWDHYNDEPVVIVEDLDRSHSKLGYHLKIWADHYPFIAEMKGSSRKIRPSRIFVTSNYKPHEIWPDDPGMYATIERRYVVKSFYMLFVKSFYIGWRSWSILRGWSYNFNKLWKVFTYWNSV